MLRLPLICAWSLPIGIGSQCTGVPGCHDHALLKVRCSLWLSGILPCYVLGSEKALNHEHTSMHTLTQDLREH